MPALKIARDTCMAKEGYARFDYIPEDVRERFIDLFERAGYVKLPESGKQLIPMWEYMGNSDPRNNLEQYYRIVGLDPETHRRKSVYRSKH